MRKNKGIYALAGFAVGILLTGMVESAPVWATELTDEAASMQLAAGAACTAVTVEDVEKASYTQQNETWKWRIEDDNTVTITGYLGEDSVVVVPATLSDLPVKKIGHIAFWGCGMTSITLPEGLMEIEYRAFDDCSNLTSITMPESLTTIGDSAFLSCRSLETVVLTDNVTEIGKYAFDFCESLTNVTFPKGITVLPEGMFRGCNALTQITIPEGVTETGAYMFAECKNLTKVNLPSTLTVLADGTFHRCTALENVVLPEGLTYLGDSAFCFCEKINHLVVPKGVTVISDFAFAGCVALTDFEMKGQITEIGAEAFNEAGVKDLVLPDTVKTIGRGAFVWSDIANINIPEGVERIEEGTFLNCFFLTDLVLPSSVKYIGKEAFSACAAMRMITIMNPECKIYNAEDTIAIGGLAPGVICGFADSTAAVYAEKFEKNFEALLEPEDGTDMPEDSDTPTEPTLDEESVKQFVSRMYTVALNRTEDPVGHADWTGWLLSQEMKGADIAQGFILSEEFVNRNLSDEAYVKVLYRTFFDREADAAGKQTWLELLAGGTDRAFVLAGFVNSAEFDSLCTAYGILRGEMSVTGEVAGKQGIEGFVERMYTKALNRSSDPTGLTTWSNLITTGQMSAEDVAKSFFLSEEFVNRNLSDEDYVETLYQTFMGRASDGAGKTDWVNHLGNGMDRVTVLEGFSRSVEFTAILVEYGL